jgi:hypothetical protein
MPEYTVYAYREMSTFKLLVFKVPLMKNLLDMNYFICFIILFTLLH